MVCDITTSLQGSSGPIFSIQKCDLETSIAHTLRIAFSILEIKNINIIIDSGILNGGNGLNVILTI